MPGVAAHTPQGTKATTATHAASLPPRWHVNRTTSSFRPHAGKAPTRAEGRHSVLALHHCALLILLRPHLHWLWPKHRRKHLGVTHLKQRGAVGGGKDAELGLELANLRGAPAPGGRRENGGGDGRRQAGSGGGSNSRRQRVPRGWRLFRSQRSMLRAAMLPQRLQLGDSDLGHPAGCWIFSMPLSAPSIQAQSFCAYILHRLSGAGGVPTRLMGLRGETRVSRK